jgi:hypothetical protein
MDEGGSSLLRWVSSLWGFIPSQLIPSRGSVLICAICIADACRTPQHGEERRGEWRALRVEWSGVEWSGVGWGANTCVERMTETSDNPLANLLFSNPDVDKRKLKMPWGLSSLLGTRTWVHRAHMCRLHVHRLHAHRDARAGYTCIG